MFMKRFCVFLVLLVSVSCTKKQPLPEPVCKSVFKATSAAASLIAAALQCKNTGAIAADISEPFLKLGLCADTAAQSTLTDLICPQISAILTSVVTGAVPTAWECSNLIVSDIIKTQLEKSCSEVVH
jgi:hypothetical protein